MFGMRILKTSNIKNLIAQFRQRSFSTSISVNTRMEKLSQMACLEGAPKDPVQFFLDLLNIYNTSNPTKKYVPMNVATMDREFGALNRTVVYRGLTDNHVTFVTEKNSRKYLNLLDDPRISVTFFWDMLNINGAVSTWQVRLMGKAEELTTNQLSNLWSEEPVFAKIRSRICECGKPIDYLRLKESHDSLLKAYENGEDMLPQTATFTAFKIVPTIWDFYKSELNSIADRVQYRKANPEDEKWDKLHIAA